VNDELHRLRVVAQAAAVYLRADEETLSHLRRWDDPNHERNEASVQEARRLSLAARKCRAELARALARVAELNRGECEQP